ncbi:NADP-dependent oxidoreductase [Microbacterium terrisoli]|uniref:NADP-dependent oxidoreductase n=1 Tax=Microbacterium terrisoli TaxID=3242192 RepID=UPI002803F4EA|nr:NADP-dependent oxidoreductase [Microbacterium protaetiae]
MATVSSRVVRFHEYGEPLDVLREERIEIFDPAPGRLRVRVLATGLNPADWELCRGFLRGTLPRGIGCDVAGVVDAIGDGVDDVSVGDLVAGAADVAEQESAGAADYAILASWTRVPAGLDPVQAAVLRTVVQTAVWTLDAMGVDAHTTLLVHGAGSMVGYAAVQVARERGATVIATAGRALAADLEGFGAKVTAYGAGMGDRVRALADGAIDLVLDAAPSTVGTIPALIAIAGDPGHVFTVSNHADARELGAVVNLDLLRGGGGLPTDPMPDYVAKAARGEFRLPIARAFALDDWRSAAGLSLSRAAHGKVVLRP